MVRSSWSSVRTLRTLVRVVALYCTTYFGSQTVAVEEIGQVSIVGGLVVPCHMPQPCAPETVTPSTLGSTPPSGAPPLLISYMVIEVQPVVLRICFKLQSAPMPPALAPQM